MIEQPYIGEMEQKITVNKKGFLLFIAVLYVVAILIGCAALLYNQPFTERIQLSGLLLLGFIYVLGMQKKFAAPESKELFSKAIYFSLALFLALSTIYFFKGAWKLFEILPLCCAFLLPATVTESWRMFSAISGDQKKPWYYANDIPPEPIFVYLENISVRLRLMIDNETVSELKSTAPTSLKLGTAFYYIVKAQNPAGQENSLFLDQKETPYGWLFYTRKNLSKVYLKPDETILENKIKPNTVIFAERIS